MAASISELGPNGAKDVTTHATNVVLITLDENHKNIIMHSDTAFRLWDVTADTTNTWTDGAAPPGGANDGAYFTSGVVHSWRAEVSGVGKFQAPRDQGAGRVYAVKADSSAGTLNIWCQSANIAS